MVTTLRLSDWSGFELKIDTVLKEEERLQKKFDEILKEEYRNLDDKEIWLHNDKNRYLKEISKSVIPLSLSKIYDFTKADLLKVVLLREIRYHDMVVEWESAVKNDTKSSFLLKRVKELTKISAEKSDFHFYCILQRVLKATNVLKKRLKPLQVLGVSSERCGVCGDFKAHWQSKKVCYRCMLTKVSNKVFG